MVRQMISHPSSENGLRSQEPMCYQGTAVVTVSFQRLISLQCFHVGIKGRAHASTVCTVPTRWAKGSCHTCPSDNLGKSVIVETSNLIDQPKQHRFYCIISIDTTQWISCGRQTASFH